MSQPFLSQRSLWPDLTFVTAPPPHPFPSGWSLQYLLLCLFRLQELTAAQNALAVHLNLQQELTAIIADLDALLTEAFPMLVEKSRIPLDNEFEIDEGMEDVLVSSLIYIY